MATIAVSKNPISLEESAQWLGQLDKKPVLQRIYLVSAKIISDAISCMQQRINNFFYQPNPFADTVFLAMERQLKDPFLVNMKPIIIDADLMYHPSQKKICQRINELSFEKMPSQVVLILPVRSSESFLYFLDEPKDKDRKLCPLYEILTNKLKKTVRVIIDVSPKHQDRYMWQKGFTGTCSSIKSLQPIFGKLHESESVIPTVHPNFNRMLRNWGICKIGRIF